MLGYLPHSCLHTVTVMYAKTKAVISTNENIHDNASQRLHMLLCSPASKCQIREICFLCQCKESLGDNIN